LLDAKPGGRLISRRTPESINHVKEIVSENPRLSVRKIAAATNLSYSITQTILRVDLKLFPYKVHLSQELKDKDFEMRKKHCETMLRRLKSEGIQLFDKLYHSDEAWFQLTGYHNRQNERVWADQNNAPAKASKSLHPAKIGVWAAMSRSRIIGPVFFDSTVNSETYLTFIDEFVNSFSSEELDNIQFQQDGARPHTCNATMNRLYELFPPDNVISHPDWPARSPDLSTHNNFLWSYLKNRIYNNNPKTIEELKLNITRHIREIDTQTLANVYDNLVQKLQLCYSQNGGTFEHLLKKGKRANFVSDENFISEDENSLDGDP
jgi:hypothetical protein